MSSSLRRSIRDERYRKAQALAQVAPKSCERCDRLLEAMQWARERLWNVQELTDDHHIHASLEAIANALDPEKNPKIRNP